VNVEINAALVGHSIGNVHAGYGAKEIVRRFGRRLADAVAAVAYDGLDLSDLKPPAARSRPRKRGRDVKRECSARSEVVGKPQQTPKG
jgi:hypothetical protein